MPKEIVIEITIQIILVKCMIGLMLTKMLKFWQKDLRNEK